MSTPASYYALISPRADGHWDIGLYGRDVDGRTIAKPIHLLEKFEVLTSTTRLTRWGAEWKAKRMLAKLERARLNLHGRNRVVIERPR